MERWIWRWFALLMVFGRVAAAGEPAVCPRVSAGDSILGFVDSCLASDSPVASAELIGVVEGDEIALQRALSLVYRNREEYVAVLFYAAWCPFSKICRPNFNVLSSMFPSIRHFAFEESIIRPSILSSDVTGVKPASLEPASVEKAEDPSNLVVVKEGNDQENCPFSWARSPEKLLQEETYLALASSFVLLRLLYYLLPKLNACIERTWRRHMQYASLLSLWDHSQAYLQQAKQGFYRLNPRKRSNLQEGAMNAKAWASKSLASVTIGEPSTGRLQSSS